MSKTSTPQTRQRKVPEIAVVPEPGRVTVRVGGMVVADSTSAVVLTEGQLPPRHYLPASDVRMDLLHPTDLSTH